MKTSNAIENTPLSFLTKDELDSSIQWAKSEQKEWTLFVRKLEREQKRRNKS